MRWRDEGIDFRDENERRRELRGHEIDGRDVFREGRVVPCDPGAEGLVFGELGSRSKKEYHESVTSWAEIEEQKRAYLGDPVHPRECQLSRIDCCLSSFMGVKGVTPET
jgi:hypothetical protein